MGRSGIVNILDCAIGINSGIGNAAPTIVSRSFLVQRSQPQSGFMNRPRSQNRANFASRKRFLHLVTIPTAQFGLIIKLYVFMLLFTCPDIPLSASESTNAAEPRPITAELTEQAVVVPRINSSQWLTEKWWIIEDRYNFYLNNIRLIRDKLILDSIIGKQGKITIRTEYNLMIFRREMELLYHMIMFRYYPQHSLYQNDIDHNDVDPFISYPFSLHLNASQASRLREIIVEKAHDDLDLESQLNIGAYFISWASDYKTDWRAVRDVIVSSEWIIALGISALQYNQNQIGMSLVIPAFRFPSHRLAGLAKLGKFGEAMSPQLDLGLIYENKLFAVTTLVRSRYGDEEMYNFIKETFMVKVNADLFSRTSMGNYLKIRWQNSIETRIAASDRQLTKNVYTSFTALHEYSLYIVASKSKPIVERAYKIKFRFLDFNLNTTSISIPAIIVQRVAGIWPLTNEPLFFKMFFNGGYGFPFSLDVETDQERDFYFLIGMNILY